MNGNSKSSTSKVRLPRPRVQFGPPGAQPIVQPQPVQVQPVQPKSVQPKSVQQVETHTLRIAQE
jgi:hypothetical protein